MTATYRDFDLYRRLMRQARSSWVAIAALFVVGLLATPLALLTPLPLKIAVDSVIGSHPLPGFLGALLPAAVSRSPTALLGFVATLAVLIAVLTQLQAFGQRYLSATAGEKLLLDFRARIFRHLQRVSLSYHDSTGTADSVYRIQNDAPALRYIVIDGFIPFISSALTLIGMVYVTLRIDWQLALVALATAPALLLVSRRYRPRLRAQSREVKKLESAAMSVVHEVIGALRVVKAFGQEEREGDRFVRRSKEGMRHRIQLGLAEGHFNVLVGLVTAIGLAAVLFIGVDHVRSGVLSLGDLLLVIGYVGKLYEPMKTISRKMATLQGYLASVERAFSLLDEKPDVTERGDVRPVARAHGAVAFEGVSFSYAEDRPVLHDISFEIGPGTRLGIAGTTGAGKSTLISLVTRLYDPTEGRILLDGIDLRDYRLDDLRRQFAIVPQDAVLFSTSIGENIAYGMPGASREQIVAAAHAANAHEFIERLPQGYDTQVAERGVKLSGGQRQRIALARAFLRNSPVLILDEPTSAVDAHTEAAIVDALERLQRGRTVILISHRPTTLAGTSAVLVLENGRVVTDTISGRSETPSIVSRSTRGVAAPASRAKRQENLRAHPAVQAWQRLDPTHRLPERISPAKVKPHQRRTPVYRLEGAGPDGAAVIAKAGSHASIAVERVVYERFLRHLPLAAAHYYGCVADPAGDLTWLFIQEVRGEEYSYLLPEHRVHAARWLAILHSGAPAVAAPAGVPDIGPGRYLGQLRMARDSVRTHYDNPTLTGEQLTFLDTLLERFDDVEERWDRITEPCTGVPHTLVHGDLSGKNVRVQAAGAGIVVFDWEDAGWGVPATDLAQFLHPTSRLSAGPDLATYWSLAGDRWPNRGQADLERLACCGTVFRALAALQWDAHHLGHEWAEWFVPSLRLYDAELGHALDRLDRRQPTSSRQEVVGT